MPTEAQKTFEQNMEAMSKMSPAEVQTKLKELDKICICGKCPTYIETGMCSGLSSPFRWKCPTYSIVGTGAYKHTFCVIGKSSKIKMDKGCLCLTCPVQKNLALRWDRYCLKGSGNEQLGIK
jgi:hypothetical protein